METVLLLTLLDVHRPALMACCQDLDAQVAMEWVPNVNFDREALINGTSVDVGAVLPIIGCGWILREIQPAAQR